MKRVFFVIVLGAIAFNFAIGQNVQVQQWGVAPGDFDRTLSFGNNPASELFYNDMRIKFGRLGEEVNLGLEDIEGTIYTNENFTLGTLYDKGEAFKKLYMRYDAYNDEIELKESLNSTDVMAMVKHPVYSCAINGDEFYYLVYKDEDGNQEEGYLTPIVAGDDYALFVKHIKVFKEGKQAKTSLDNSFPHRFLDKTDYYVARAGEMPEYLKTKKSEVLSVFIENDREAVKDYFKDKRPNVKDDQDLTNLFVYANSL